MRGGRVGGAVVAVAALAALLACPQSQAQTPAVVAAGPTPSYSDVVLGALQRATPSAVPTPPTTSVVPAPAPAALTADQVQLADAVDPVGSRGIPVRVLAAYRNAAALEAAADPGCHLDWALLAGIGRIESDHASGGRVDGAGTTRGRILGPLLDGSLPGTAVVVDTDGGVLDGNASFDRATGPMQFLPATWRGIGADANGDGVADPDNVDDAAFGAARYLCAGGGDLADPAGLAAALFRYNRSTVYAADVLAWAQAYRSGVAAVPDAPGVVPEAPEVGNAITPTAPSPALAPGGEPAAPVTPPAPAATVAPPPPVPPVSPPAQTPAPGPGTPGAGPSTLPSTTPSTPSPPAAASPEATSPVVTPTPPPTSAAPTSAPPTTASPTSAPPPSTPPTSAPPPAPAPTVTTAPSAPTSTTTTSPPTTAPRPAPTTTPAPPPCPAASVVRPSATRALPDGGLLLRFAPPIPPAGCRVATATLSLDPGSAAAATPLSVVRVAGAWSATTVAEPATAGPAVVSPAASGMRTWVVTGLVGGLDGGLLVRGAGVPVGPVRLTVTFTS